MNVTTTRPPPSWTARLAWALLLLLAGGGLAIWGLSRWDVGARFFGVTPALAPISAPRLAVAPVTPALPTRAEIERVAALEARLNLLERQTLSVQGSAGRADALVIAFAARRALERGVALGYLEPLLVERFGANHQAAVATIVTASRNPVTQAELIAEYDRLEGLLRGTGPDEGWWVGARRELGTLISIRRNDSPSPRPAARFDRARARLDSGEIDAALAETMRLPGAARPETQGWIIRARRLIAAKRALDQIESAALVGPVRPPIGA
ncbi:MAG: hypothetical protein LH466_03955 [Sphingomonas bacterium]|nr:hypothetical protein [Sphingomonas bacterium]